MHLLVQENRFKSLIQAINRRSRFHSDTIQPLLEQGGFGENGPFHIQDIQRILGDRNFTTITRSTDEVIDFVNETIVSLREIGDSLNAKLVELFPKSKSNFLSFRE